MRFKALLVLAAVLSGIFSPVCLDAGYREDGSVIATLDVCSVSSAHSLSADTPFIAEFQDERPELLQTHVFIRTAQPSYRSLFVFNEEHPPEA